MSSIAQYSYIRTGRLLRWIFSIYLMIKIFHGNQQQIKHNYVIMKIFTVTTALVTNQLFCMTHVIFVKFYMAIVTPHNELPCKTKTHHHSKVIEVEGSNNQWKPQIHNKNYALQSPQFKQITPPVYDQCLKLVIYIARSNFYKNKQISMPIPWSMM